MSRGTRIKPVSGALKQQRRATVVVYAQHSLASTRRVVGSGASAFSRIPAEAQTRVGPRRGARLCHWLQRILWRRLTVFYAVSEAGATPLALSPPAIYAVRSTPNPGTLSANYKEQGWGEEGVGPTARGKVSERPRLPSPLVDAL